MSLLELLIAAKNSKDTKSKKGDEWTNKQTNGLKIIRYTFTMLLFTVLVKDF